MQKIKYTSEKTKTYNSGYSLVVTHLTTNPPVRCLNRAERTGSLVFNVLWSYVADMSDSQYIISFVKHAKRKVATNNVSRQHI
jgi:fibronectin type 3 domain-containing protein